MNTVRDYVALRAIIMDSSPELIGISLRNVDTSDAADPGGFVEECRELVDILRGCSSAILVCGGSGFTLFPEAILKAVGADYGIIGEGERLALFLDALEDGKDVGEIPGVVSPDRPKDMPEPWNKKIVRHFNGGYSHTEFYLKKGGMLNLQTKRGCYFKCIYCSYPHIEGRSLRHIPPEEVAKTAIGLQDAGAKFFFVADAVFNSDIPQSIAVAKAFRKAGVSIPWGAFLAPMKLPVDYFRILADAGMTHVEFGTESLSDTMLTSYRKPFSVENVFEAHKNALDAGLYVAHYFLLGGPNESSETLDETFSRAEMLDKTVLFFFCGVRIYPNTQLYHMALEEGSILESRDLLKPVFYRPKSLDIDETTRVVAAWCGRRLNWLLGSGGQEAVDVVARMHERGYSGPRWEILAG